MEMVITNSLFLRVPDSNNFKRSPKHPKTLFILITKTPTPKSAEEEEDSYISHLEPLPAEGPGGNSHRGALEAKSLGLGFPGEL